ncbi:MAG: ATP-binding cassette domain-containing protein [Chromatiaceae bacterium]
MADRELDLVEVRGLRSAFGATCVHEDLNLTVRRGEIMALVGASGAGKSVLLREIILLLRPAAGSVHLFGEPASGLDEAEANRLRRRIGIMFQQGALFSSLTVEENVAVPLREQTDLPEPLIREIARLKIVLAGLSPDAAVKYPRELSGGMLKRAALARALAMDPDLLVLDEPGSGLDPVSANALDELILHLHESLGLTVLMATHDLDTLWRVAHRVAFLGEKRVLGTGTMAELSRAEHPLLREYFQGPRARATRGGVWSRA